MDRKTRQLLSQLESDSAKERYLAVVELGKRRDTSLLPHLDKVATLDDNQKVREIAYNAVRFLSILKEEEDRAAQLALAESEEDDDDSGWGKIEELLVEPLEDTEDEAGSGVWNYQEAMQAQRLAEEEERRTAEALKRRKRWRYRRFLWFATLTAVMGLVVVAVYVQDHANDPNSRQEALERLSEWHADVQATAERFDEAMNGSVFDCALYREDERFQIPERPKGLGPDRPYQDDLEESPDSLDSTVGSQPREFFSLMNEAIDNLKEFRNQNVEEFCKGVETTRAFPTDSAKNQFRIPLDDSLRSLTRARHILDKAFEELEMSDDDGES